MLVARDRSGATANIILAADGKADLVTALKPLLPSDTSLCTDGSSVLAAAVNEIGEHIVQSMSLPAAAQSPAFITPRTSMPTTVASRTGFAASTALPPSTSILSRQVQNP